MELTFEEWMQKVNRIIEGLVGISADDLADQNYRDMFDMGDTPGEAARTVLENEGFE